MPRTEVKDGKLLTWEQLKEAFPDAAAAFWDILAAADRFGYHGGPDDWRSSFDSDIGERFLVADCSPLELISQPPPDCSGAESFCWHLGDERWQVYEGEWPLRKETPAFAPRIQIGDRVLCTRRGGSSGGAHDIVGTVLNADLPDGLCRVQPDPTPIRHLVPRPTYSAIKDTFLLLEENFDE